jgi:ABC-type multidrug transport system ATPase subunit
MSTPLAFVELQDVTFTYPLKAARGWLWPRRSPARSLTSLQNISLQLPLGKHLVLFGQSGAGKSTLLRLLAGYLAPTSGSLLVNGRPPMGQFLNQIGYVGSQSSPLGVSTAVSVGQHLQALAKKAGRTSGLPSELGVLDEYLQLSSLLNRPLPALSASETVRFRLATALLSDTPLLLFDDLADYLDLALLQALLRQLLSGRTVIISTRQPAVAEALALPLLVLHQYRLATPPGTQHELTQRLACPFRLDAWIEDLQYSLIRSLQQTPGVKVNELHSCHSFGGQRLRLSITSSHHLPLVYERLSRAALIRVEEHPAQLSDIVNRL